MTTEMFPPLQLMDFSMTHSHMTKRHSSMIHSSHSGAWLNSFVILFPLITYHPHDESQVLSYCHPVSLLWLHFLCCIIISPWLRYCAYWGCASWLISDSFLTHFFDSHYSPCVTSQALGYPTCRSGLVVPDVRGFWTEASACALHRPSVAVQVFWVIGRYMCSLVGKSQSWGYHRNSLPGTCKSRGGRIKSQTTSGVGRCRRAQKTWVGHE